MLLIHEVCCQSINHAAKAYTMLPKPKHTGTPCNGPSTVPTVSCDVSNFKYTSRKVETLALSLLYDPNNLLNSFLFAYFFSCCETPLCGCGGGVKSLFYVVFECNCSENRQNIINQLIVTCENVSDRSILTRYKCIILLNLSRFANFFPLLISHVTKCLPYLKHSVTTVS